MSIWNVIVMLFVIVLVPYMQSDWENYDQYASIASYTDAEKAIRTDKVKDNSKANKRLHLTYIFNVFVFLQIFNEINCRKTGRQDFNVIEKLFTFGHNWYFLIVVVGTFAVQICMCEIASLATITGTMSMNRAEWGACIIIGATPLLISLLLKLTPDSWMIKYFSLKTINEDECVDNKCLNMYKSASKNPLQNKKKKDNKDKDQGQEENGEAEGKQGDEFGENLK